MGNVALAVSLSMAVAIGGGVLALFMCIRHRKRQRQFSRSGVRDKEAERRGMLDEQSQQQAQPPAKSKNVAVVIGMRSGGLQAQSSVPLITTGSPGSQDEKEGALSSSVDSSERGQQQQQQQQKDTHLAVKPSLKVPVAHAKSNSSVGSGASRSSLRSLQECAEIVAERARRMASGEASICRKPSDEKPPLGVAAKCVSTASESTLSPSTKDVMASDTYVQRARSISAVVAAKQQEAHQRKLAKQSAVKARKASALQAATTTSHLTSFARPKGLLKRERSLSLPVISVEANGACSFLFDDPESSDSEGGNKIANPYSHVGKSRAPPAQRKPLNSLPPMAVSPAAVNVAHAEIWKVEEVTTRAAPMTGAVEIVDLIMSDPEGDFDSTEEEHLFVPRPIVARVEPRKQKGHSMSHVASLSRSVQPRRVSQERPVSMTQMVQQASKGAPQGTGSALQPAPGESPMLQRGSRFKRSRRSSQKQRVRVVGRAVTFHSHSGPPRRTEHAATPRPSLPTAISGQQATRTMANRRSSVIEVDPTGTPGDSSGPGGEPANAASSCKFETAVSPKQNNVFPGRRMPVPANSPMSDSDSAPTAASADPTTTASPIGQHIRHAGTLPGMVTNKQKRKEREESRRRASAQATTPSPDDWPDSSLPVTITLTSPHGEETREGGRSPSADRVLGGSPALQSSAAQSNGTGRSTASPASIYSADQPVDVCNTKALSGYLDYHLSASSVNSGDRESAA